LKLLLFILASCLIRLSPTEKERIITIQEVKFHEDLTQELTFNDILRNGDQYLQYNVNFTPSDYKPRANYWVFYDFCITNEENDYLFEFYDQSIDYIEVYIRHESEENFKKYEFGDQYPFDSRSYDHKNFQIPVSLSGNYEAYVKVNNREFADIRVVIRTVNRFIEYALVEYFLYGLFYGMILIISLYNVSIYSAIREVKYLYYTFYIISVGVFAMCVDGIAYQFLWPGLPVWNQIAHGVALFSLIIWSIIFSKRFLNFKARAPKIDSLLNIIIILRVLLFVYALFFDNSIFNYRYVEIVPLSVIFYGAVKVLLRGYKPARFFVIAYGFLFFGFIYKALTLFSVVPISIITFNRATQIISYYSLHLCFLLEMLFLSLALSDRVRILKENKDRVFRRVVMQHEESIKFKDKVNAQLERRVKERTEEIQEKNQLLEESNLILEQQKKEISEINTILDLDNWKLKNDIKSIQAERLANRILTFKEFKQIFSSDSECYEFLASIKWNVSYECRKCKNEKYIQDQDTFSRRCTKCGYNETPTIDTVFKNIRFPLHKAMYVLYLQMNNSSMSLNEISDTIDLRKNTVWSFKKKIEKYYQDHGIAKLDIFREIDQLSTHIG
jgi:hypothetical protein